MHKIYFDRRCIAFCQKSEIQTPEEDIIVVPTDNIEEECKRFFASFKEVEAAGGLVSNGRGSYLLIHRNNMWDLPKGHRDEGESMVECALREVEEETGARRLKAGKLLCLTHHCYFRDNRWHLKHTTWYNMTADPDTLLIPQYSEGIAEAVWIDEKDIPAYLSDTYPSIAEVFEASGLKK